MRASTIGTHTLMSKSLLPLLACAALLLNACVELPMSDQVRLIDGSHTINNGLLEYAGSFVELSAEAQKKELAQINQSLAQNKNDLNIRMKAAMIYALPNSRQRDVVKAQVLLDDLLREKTLDNERKTLAALLRDYILENNKLSQKARDEQKRADTLQQKADSLQQKADTLQQKLDELKNIEKTMVDRDQGVRK